MDNETFQRFVQETFDQEQHDIECMHSTLDDLMMNALEEFGIDVTKIKSLLAQCWYA